MSRPILDRVASFDEKSRDFPIRTIVPKKPRSYTWSCKAWLDQGSEGACVGFAWAHELNARPQVATATEKDAFAIYQQAKTLDQWAGENYDGTSVIAGAKAVVQRLHIKEYRWCFGLEDLILAVGYAGPVVLGLNWYTGMFKPGGDGVLRVSGNLAGGHAILCNGVNLKKRMFRLHNSWGKDWGDNGECWISFDDMDRLLHEQGEACVPLHRQRKS